MSKMYKEYRKRGLLVRVLNLAYSLEVRLCCNAPL